MANPKNNPKTSKHRNFDYDAKLLADKTKQVNKESEFHKMLQTEKFETIHEMFKTSAEKYKARDFIGRRYINDDKTLGDFVWRTYEQEFERISFLACGITLLFKRCDKMAASPTKENDNQSKEDENEIQNDKNEAQNGENQAENVENNDEIAQNDDKTDEKTDDKNDEKVEEKTDEDYGLFGGMEDQSDENDDKIAEISENEPQISENELQLSENEPQISENEPMFSETEPQISENEPMSSENEPQISENKEPAPLFVEIGEGLSDGEEAEDGRTFEDYCNDAKPALGLYSINRPEWMEACLAAHMVGAKAVPIYDVFGEESILYIFNQTKLKVVVCSKDKVHKVIEAKKRGATHLQAIIQMDFDPHFNNKDDKIEKKDVAEARKCGLEIWSLNALINSGKKHIEKFAPVRPAKADLAYLMYTSGTSGNPKGVMLTHHNAMSTLRNVTYGVELVPGSLLSFLPLAHIFETLLEFMACVGGVRIGYYSGDIKALSSDILVLRPEYFAAVPRVLDRIYSKILATVEKAGFLKRFFFTRALKSGAASSREPSSLLAPKHLDSLVWAKLRAQLGFDRLRILITGGAPCPAHIFEFFRVALRAQVLQGYGLTETFAAVTLTQGGDANLGHVGLPLGLRLRLVAVPDTPYSPATDPPSGEVLVRGPGVFKGYFGNAEATREALEGGWLHTGDVGRLNPNGTLSVVDRAKALFKLAQGEYVSPEKVEAAYARSAAVAQVFVHGEPFHNFAVAVVVPAAGWVLDELAAAGVAGKDVVKSIQDALATDDNQKALAEYAALGEKHRGLAEKLVLVALEKQDALLLGFERVTKLHLEFELDRTLAGFTVENDCLTPSFKLRRHFLLKRYREAIDAMYRDDLG